MSSEALVGSILAGRFRIVKVLGEGGMGTVYEAMHVLLPRRFAVKVLHKGLAEDRRFIERFRREAVASGRVNHPNIVQINDFGSTDDTWFMAMEYVTGETIDEVLRRHATIELRRVVPILIQMADALAHAHKLGIIHRDLKPENVLLTTDRDMADYVKIFDFGIARIQSRTYQERLTLQGQIYGTAEYVSPEQAMDQEIDGRSDLYAVGVMAYEMVTGRCPFEGNPAEVLMAHLSEPPTAPSRRTGPQPPLFDRIVLRLLAKKPEERYQNGGELRRDLLRLRALLCGVPEGMLGTRMLSRRRRMADSGEWRPIGARPPAPSMMGKAADPSCSDAWRPIQDAPSRSRSGAAGADGGAQARARLQAVLRRLAIEVCARGLGSDEIAGTLGELLGREEEMAALRGRSEEAERALERMRFESGEREASLRYALTTLRMERQRRAAAGEADPAALADLDFQIGEIARGLEETEAEREQRVAALEQELADARARLAQAGDEAAHLYHTLASVLDGARAPARDDAGLGALFEELDKLGDARLAAP